MTASNNDVVVPQAGSFTETGDPASSSFTGHVTIGSAQTQLTHELTLMPFLGRSFQNSYIYIGAGPSLFNVESSIYNGTGYADVNGDIGNDITGNPASFTNSNWVWGAAAQIGMTYFFDASFFLDVNYNYALTQHYTVSDSSAFSSSFTSNGGSYRSSGTFYVDNRQYQTVQGVMLSINKVFN